jgi:hypothetical protein
MSPVVLALDLLLVSLLVLTLVLGVRLNGRLKGLKQSHAGFEKAVSELNQAAARAEARLERANFQAEKAAEAVVRAKAELPSLATSRAEAAATRSAMPSVTAKSPQMSSAQMSSAQMSSAQTPSAQTPSAQRPNHQTSGAPMSDSLATIAALVGDAPRSDSRAAPTAKIPPNPAISLGASVRRSRPSFDEDLFESDEPDFVSRSAPLSASDLGPSILRSRAKDYRS